MQTIRYQVPPPSSLPLFYRRIFSAMAEREKQKSGGSWQWLGPESNRHYLHYCIVLKTEWKADADHLLPSLSFPRSAPLFYCKTFWGIAKGTKKT
jgi:hypothetical protein